MRRRRSVCAPWGGTSATRSRIEFVPQSIAATRLTCSPVLWLDSALVPLLGRGHQSPPRSLRSSLAGARCDAHSLSAPGISLRCSLDRRSRGAHPPPPPYERSDERRVGKECRFWWAPYD